MGGYILLYLSHDHFIVPKAERGIPLLVTKMGFNIITDMIFDPPPSNCGWFRLVCLTHDHFINLKAEKRKTPFLVTKRGEKSYLTCFSDPRPPNYGTRKQIT